MSFQWLSTDMPVKYSSNPKFPENVGNDSTAETNAGSRLLSSEKGNIELKSSLKDKYEDDWRYLAVTAFLVKCAGSRITVCFIVVACSDATLALRALVLPYRLWFDVAVLLPLASPVLAFQHVILPTCVPSEGVWTDGSWVFSTGLDQRVRCWRLEDEGKLIEGASFIISVPEPEALDAKLCGRNHYQIAVAGRGMQMLEFSESSNVS